jgi:hypothetical protein
MCGTCPPAPVSQYPDATFQGDPVAVPASLENGQTATVSVPGQLTVEFQLVLVRA